MTRIRRPTFEQSENTRLIYAAMKRVVPGAIITNIEISAAVSRPIGEIRGAVATALRRCLRDDGIVFVSVRGVGYQRALSPQIVASASADTRRIRRAARRGLDKLGAVNHDDLNNAQRLQHGVRASMLSLAAHVTQETTAPKIAAALGAENKKLPIGDMLKALSG